MPRRPNHPIGYDAATRRSPERLALRCERLALGSERLALHGSRGARGFQPSGTARTAGGHMRRMEILAFVLAMIAPARAQRPLISTNPDTPSKLATFPAPGRIRLAIRL